MKLTKSVILRVSIITIISVRFEIQRHIHPKIMEHKRPLVGDVRYTVTAFPYLYTRLNPTKRRQSTVIVMALHHKSASLNPTELDRRPPWSSTQIRSSISIKISLMHPCLFSPPTSSQSPFHLSTAGVLIALVISMVSLEISSLELIVLPREVLSNNSKS